MANSNAVSSSLPSRDYHCKVCDLYLDSIDSLEVHLQYHKENLYVKWGTQNSQNDADNNNAARVKSETTVSAPADSSDNMITKPSPEFQQRGTPETSAQFPHPATPQSYHSAPSPYQNPEQTGFSPGAQFTGAQYTHAPFPSGQHAEQLSWEQSQYGQQEYHKPSPRFHPYAGVQERAPQVSSSSPLYPQPLSQPTPSPSPNQCDKCGFVCDSAMQLTEHCNTAHSNAAHPPGQYQHVQQFPPKPFPGFPGETKVKEEQEESSDILDLDSQKVVYPGTETDQPGAANFEPTSVQGRDNHRSAPTMLPWENQKLYSNPPMNGESALFKEQKMFSEQKSFAPDTKMYHPEHKFSYSQDKSFIPGHHDQKPFLHPDQKIYSSVQIPSLGIQEYSNNSVSSNPDMKPPYRPYDSPAPQITSTQTANPSSTALPSISGKGANWKSNEARRPKTYNCTACNKWFTSSGHLKRHYNTTLHKNAVRSSGQPDPATLPISNHHHPSRDQNRGPPPPDSNTHSPGSGDDGRGVDEGVLQSPYPSQSYERSHRASSIQSKSPYSHLQQGNLDNNFMSNNPLANHPLPHQVGTHPLNIGSQPPGIGNPNESSLQGAKCSPNSSTGNPPNGEAGPSVSQNHHMRGLLSVSTSNISTPALPQSTPQITPHTLPPFSHLGVNPYSPRSTDPLGHTVPDPTHTPLYLGQNFQQSIAPNYPNGMAPHVMDMAINNLHIASQVTFGNSIPEVTEVMDMETSDESSACRLPSFAQIQSQRFGIFIPNYVTSPNVGGPSPGEVTADTYLIIDSPNNGLQYNQAYMNDQRNDNEYGFAAKTMKIESLPSEGEIKMANFEFSLGRTIKEELTDDISELQIIKMEDIMDYANKENYEKQMNSPGSPESAKAEYESGGSPSVTSTVPCPPLVESNKPPPKLVHKCFECDKTFNKACYLTQHNKTFHSGEKPFKCERCGKRFSDDASYVEHFSKHAGMKPFKCVECPKSFNHKTDLRRHMCLHSGTKPFACHHCGKGFIRKDHMLKHCETHRKKPFRPPTS